MILCCTDSDSGVKEGVSRPDAVPCHHHDAVPGLHVLWLGCFRSLSHQSKWFYIWLYVLWLGRLRSLSHLISGSISAGLKGDLKQSNKFTGDTRYMDIVTCFVLCLIEVNFFSFAI